jgi:hypothetical protein
MHGFEFQFGTEMVRSLLTRRQYVENEQRSWMYLESIFSAPDIQKQLPKETVQFLRVDQVGQLCCRTIFEPSWSIAWQ